MPELTVQDLTAKLRSERFDRATPAVQALTDPIVDTPMVVTLDELRPYELNPRIARNPKYDELEASIRERGLDAPPSITRRPGEAHFVIRSGGNTRLAILRELWTETKEERFFRIPCLFRPWSPRGEIVALTGHLAENELHGDLSFIERALGVEKARELYEQETGKPLSQRELARRLTADGYPISHALVNRMQDTVRHLLPAIPTVLYGGLGRPQVERLAALRKAGSRVWERHAQSAQATVDFQTLFQDVLSSLDADPERFSTQRVQDELLRQMTRLLSSDYDTLALEIIDVDGIADAINRDPVAQPPLNAPFPVEERVASRSPLGAGPHKTTSAPAQAHARSGRTTIPSEPERTPPSAQRNGRDDEDWDEEPLTDAGERPQPPSTIHPEEGEAIEENQPNVHDNILRSGATRTEGLHSASDVWHIEPSLDQPSHLRSQIARLATDIAREGSLTDRIKAVEDGVGYVCIASRSRSEESTLSPFQRALVALLTALSATYTQSADAAVGRDRHVDVLGDELGPLLQGAPNREHAEPTMRRISDAGLEKLFRSICLARRLLDLASAESSPSDREMP